MMSKPLFAFLTAQVLYLQLYFTSGKLLKWPSIIVLVNYEFLVIFIKQEWLLANFVKGVENWLQSDQYKFGADCTFHGFLEHPNDISLSTMTIFHEHPRAATSGAGYLWVKSLQANWEVGGFSPVLLENLVGNNFTCCACKCASSGSLKTCVNENLMKDYSYWISKNIKLTKYSPGPTQKGICRRRSQA